MQVNHGGKTAKQTGLVSCHICHLLCRDVKAKKIVCPRCGGLLHSRKPESISRTWALVLTALIFYIPANLYPMTHTTSFGNVQSDTILSGVVFFYETGSWPVALIIFIASVFVPLLKLLILVVLLLSVQLGFGICPVDRTHLYRLTELIGRWSMLDVYVVTILVALVHVGAFADIEAGMGAIYFAAVVVVTMLAAKTFDPRLIWDNLEK